MKVRAIVLALLMVLASVATAQSNFTVALLTGYTMTSFEDQEDAAGTLPIAVRVSKALKPNLEVGLEGNYALGGFGFESDWEGETMTTTFDQTIIDAFAKYSVGNSKLQPYLKGGLGFFMGNAKSELGDEEETTDIDSGIGFILGAGAELTPKIFAEFNYNIVSRDIEDESFGMNTWSVLVGYKIIQ